MAVMVRFSLGAVQLEEGRWRAVSGEAAPPAHFLELLNRHFCSTDALPMGYYPDPEMAIAKAAASEFHGMVLNPERQAPYQNDPPGAVY